VVRKMESKEYLQHLKDNELEDVTRLYGSDRFMARPLDLVGLSETYPMAPFTSMGMGGNIPSKKYNLQAELNRFYNYFIWPTRDTVTLGDIGRAWFPSTAQKEKYSVEDAARAKEKADFEAAKSTMTPAEAKTYTLTQYKADIMMKQQSTKAQLEAQLAQANPEDRAAITEKLAAANAQYKAVADANSKGDVALKKLIAKMGRIKGKIDVYNNKNLRDTKSRAKVRAWIKEYDSIAKEGKLANYDVQQLKEAQSSMKVAGALNYQTAVNQATSGSKSIGEAFDGFDIGKAWFTPAQLSLAVGAINPIAGVLVYIGTAQKKADKLEETIVSESTEIDKIEATYQSITVPYDPATMPYTQIVQMTDFQGKPITATRLGDQIILPTGTQDSTKTQYDSSIIKQEGNVTSDAGKTGAPAGSGKTLVEQLMSPTTLLIVGGGALILLLVLSSGKKKSQEPVYYQPQQ